MSMTREQILQSHASARVYQARFDSAFEPWGMRAKAPVIGEDVNAAAISQSRANASYPKTTNCVLSSTDR
jgi:hypothetical protein